MRILGRDLQERDSKSQVPEAASISAPSMKQDSVAAMEGESGRNQR